MTPEDQALHDEAHEAFVAITLRMGKRSFNQQKQAIEAWLNKYVPLVEARGLTEGVVAMRRNAVDWLISEAAETKRPAAPLSRCCATWTRLAGPISNGRH